MENLKNLSTEELFELKKKYEYEEAKFDNLQMGLKIL